jgi:glycosyltransferase involved in cell wall biosynthesis
MRKLLLIVNDPAYFLSHRLEMAVRAKDHDYEVHIASKGGNLNERIREYGFKFHKLPLSRSGLNPLAEILTLFKIWRLLLRVRPEFMHLVTIKPALYGGVAARFAPVGRLVGAMAGLGYMFMATNLWVAALRRFIVAILWFAFAKDSARILFQNPDDRQLFVDLNVVPESRTRLIRGSGVDLSRYAYVEEPTNSPLVVTFAARLLFDKGIQEYVGAACILKERGIDAIFQIVGNLDSGNPTSVNRVQLASWSI